MKAKEFMEQLKKSEEPHSEFSKQSASEFFSGEGRKMLNIIKKRANIINESSFMISDWDITQLQNEEIYKGRNFVNDMEELGFTWRVSSLYTGILPIKTLVFTANN